MANMQTPAEDLSPQLRKAVRDRLMADAAKEKSEVTHFTMPVDDPERLVAWLEAKRKRGNKRMPDLQMKMNLAYTLGHQWIVWDRDRRQFRRPQWRPNDPNAPVRITINKIGGIVERTIARLLKEAPDPECRPTSDDEDDVGAAQVGTRILDHEMDREKWDTKLIDLYFWVTVLGWSYLHVYWDPNAGTILGELPMGALGGDGENPAQDAAEDQPGMVIHTGEVVCEVVPAFELAVDPNARKMEEARWAVRTVSLTKEACWEKFGVVPDTDITGRTLVDEVYALTDKARNDRPYVDTVAVHQMWIAPGTRMAPDGAVVTWAGTTILEQREFPYDHKHIPFIQFDLMPGLGTREGRTWLNDLIPIQADYNDARSREASIRRMMVPKMLYPIGSMDPQRVSSRFEMIPYTPTGNPPNLMMPDGRWMAPHEAVMTRSQAEMGERAGQADVSNGSAPASMPAASVMALQEADDTKLAISMKHLSKGISQTGWQWLMLVKQFWQEPRIVRAWSQEGDIEAESFIGSDLGQQLDVHVSAESSLPKSKAARMNLLMELVQIPGMFTNPRDFLKQLDLPGISPLLASMSVDNKQATRENAKLCDGIAVQVNYWDNHPVHIQEHNDFRKTEMYEKIATAAVTGDSMAQQVVQAFNAHVQVHEEQMVAQQQMGPQLPGQPDGQPGSVNPPPDPAAPTPHGQAPAGSERGIHQRSGVGGPGEPGVVPGIPADQQAARLGH